MKRLTIGLALPVLAMLLFGLASMSEVRHTHANHIPYAVGDVFAAIGNGKVNHFDADGTLSETLDTTLSGVYTTGMAFDSTGNLYVTDFNGQAVTKFNTQGGLIGSFGSGYNADPESITLDAAGNFYVGQADGTRDILKFDSTGAPAGSFDVPVGNPARGSDWIDLAGDQCTMFYTSEATAVLRYNVCTSTALPDFNVAPLPGSNAYALRILPDGGVIVADTQAVERLDAGGNLVQTYDAAGEDDWFAANLDPDGTSFWSGNLGSGQVYRFDLASGAVIAPTPWSSGSINALGGLAVFGEPCVSCPPPPLPPTVILVHGYDLNSGQESCGMDALWQWLDDPSHTGGHPFNVLCLVYKTSGGVAAGASDLQNFIKTYIPDNKKVDIVAHSGGGLVARYYIEQLDGRSRVRSLTMIGTPNLGTKVALFPCLTILFISDQSGCDMAYVGMNHFLQTLDNSPNYSGVSYKAIAGTIGNYDLARPNDCIVPEYSVIGNGAGYQLNFPYDPPFAVSHVHLALGALGCKGTAEMDDASVRQDIANILLNSNGFAGGSVAGNSVTPKAAGLPAGTIPGASAIAAQSGALTEGTTAELAVDMPGGQPTGTFLFQAPVRQGTTLSLTLLRPDGTPVATADPDVAVESGVTFGNIDQTEYVVASPMAGNWTMQISGTSLPSGGWPYEMQTLVPGDVSISVSTGQGHYDTGQVVPVLANVAADDVAVVDASVAAEITEPDGSVDALTLASDGTGNYASSFSDTSQCGTYEVVITASGMDSGGTPFTRLEQGLFVVGVPGNLILDPCVGDSDGDGLTDSDEMTIYHTNPAAADTDGDGCTDARELGSTANLGGQRDPTNPWDYFNPTHDGQNRIDDVLAVVSHYNKNAGDPGYLTDDDRTYIGPNGWNLGPPNGQIRIDDVLLQVKQYNHDCA